MTLKDRVRWYWSYWRPHRFFLVFLALFTLLSSAVAVAYPLAFRSVIDRLAEAFRNAGGPGERMGNVLAILALIAAGRFVAGFYPCFRAWMNQRLEKDIREDLFNEILAKDHRFFNKFRTGDLVTRLTDDVSEYPKIAWFGCSGVFRAVESSSKLVFCLVAMLAINWELTLLAVLPLPAMLYVFYRLKTQLTKAFEQQQQAISSTNDVLEATFTGIRIVKAFQAERGQAARLDSTLKGRIDIQFQAARLWVMVHLFDTFASRVGQAIVIAAGGYMILGGTFSLGGLYAFYVYLDMLVHPMIDLPNLFVTSRQAFVCVDRLEEMRGFPADRQSSAGQPLEELDELEFRRVSAGYDEADRVLQDLRFKIPKGSKTAIVGAVGSGKSTVLRLIAGLLDPREGQILVNGRPLQAWDLDSYRKRIGYVPQEALLFSESIQDNIRFGRAIGTENVMNALAIAQMGEEIEQMPGGLDAVPGIKGSLVSGGQRQRISIARALAGSPDLLLLDDCTASLDARLEDRFWSALFAAMPNVTCLVVSHRPATILRAERILVLNRGRIAAEGTHEELMLHCEEYREFLRTAEKQEHVLQVDEIRDGRQAS